MALIITNIKRYPPQKGGIRKGLVDITFDTGGPTWVVTAAMFGLNELLDLRLPAQIDGFVLSFIPSTLTIEAREEADGGSALQQVDASDLNTKVVRAEYIGS